MNYKRTDTRFLTGLCLMTMLILIGSCTSRYRLDLFLTTGTDRTKVKVEQSRYIPGVILVDPLAEEPVQSGNGSVVILSLGFRGSQLTGFEKFAFGLDEYIKHRLYLQLPDLPKTATVQLVEHSFLKLREHYELSPESKVFLPTGGTCIIDSVTSSTMFGTLDGVFENPAGASVAIEGQFRVKL